MELTCKVQHYAWGKKGSQSKVASLYGNVNEDFKLDENLPYAELWMGTHVNGPSVMKSSGETLSAFIREHPEYLGKEVAEMFNNELPFLFKVLSVNKALSIQAHPSKKHAEELHAKYPHIYKDPNHKPELAIALTPFEALCGFREINEIRTFIQEIPELRCIVDNECFSDDSEILKKAFKAVLTCDKELMAITIQNLIKRLKTLDDGQRKIYMAELIERLNEQFPNDNGILMVYFLNYLELQPSEAIFLGPNEPHAYLFGDCIENMACSDNIVRAGLTPKLVDVETLCSMLTYKGAKPRANIFCPIDEGCFSKLYKPPVNDFAVAEYRVPSSVNTYKTLSRKSASILLVISGKARIKNMELKLGTTLFLPANDVLEISDISEELLMYQAIANIS